MNRRYAIFELISLGAISLTAQAQVGGKIPIVGMVLLSPTHSANQTIRTGLRELGYVEGTTIRIEDRYWGGLDARLPELVEGLVRLKPDLIVVFAAPAVRAAMQATSTIPIVFLGVGGDPVALGLVASLARPGGNVTGFTHMANDLDGKQIQVLKEALPTISHLGVLINPANPNKDYFASIESATKAQGLRATRVDVQETKDLEPALAAIARIPRSAVFVTADAAFAAQTASISAIALRHRLPAMFAAAADPQVAGLMYYGPNQADFYRGVPLYVDKILKGTKPIDLPVHRPTKFELVVNLKTAKALGLTIPQSLLLRADEVIQ